MEMGLEHNYTCIYILRGRCSIDFWVLCYRASGTAFVGERVAIVILKMETACWGVVTNIEGNMNRYF